ncbi:MAG: YkgJ family cysteine cluster protein [Venatoribacter sp.]
MECRAGCGACCIAPSISSPIPGMPEGKKAGERCLHLTFDNLCAIFNDPKRPTVCSQFQADSDVCGQTSEQALQLITLLELATA